VTVCFMMDGDGREARAPRLAIITDSIRCNSSRPTAEVTRARFKDRNNGGRPQNISDGVED
jgi:hypothetical protein